jgi:hypothetical protein
MAKTYRLDLFVKPNSTATEQQVIDFGLNWVNDRTNDPSNQDDNGNPINAYYCDVTDFKRGGKKYMIFGDLARDMLDLNQIHTIIDPMAMATKQEVADVEAVVDDNEARITALEQSGNEVEAVII